jgi:hypothetical protein
MEARNHLQNKPAGITSSRWNMGARRKRGGNHPSSVDLSYQLRWRDYTTG